MSTLSQRLGLKQHTLGDNFRIADYADNWDRLDDFPGVYPCLSTARPTWAAGQAGMLISETDTGLLWRWTGAAWARVSPAGLLGKTTATANFATSSTSAVTAITTAVTVPAGNRSVLLIAEAGGVASTVGITRLSLWRDATQIQSWLQEGSAGAGASAQPQPLDKTLVDTPAAGAITYTLRIAAEIGFGGTSTLVATSTSPMSLSVVEV